MNNGKYIKMDRVIETVYRDYGFDNLDWIHCVEWIGECLDLIGAPRTYIKKATDGNEKLGHPVPVTIEDNRGKIPCDMHKLIQAFRCDGQNWQPMRLNTDTTHISYYCNQSDDWGRTAEITYQLNNGFIFTDFDEGEVVFEYLANPTDENGYPMIPDNIKFIKACAAYVADKVIFKKEVQGVAIHPRVSQKIEQDKHWYIAAADSSARIPTIDEMESWKNSFLKLMPDVNAHASAFRGTGAMEKRFNNSFNDSNNLNVNRNR